jgi:hypothetical protein
LQGLSDIRARYTKLFGQPNQGESEQFESNAKRTAFEKWGWYKVIYELTDGDITKEKEYFEMKVVAFYNRLAMMADIQAEHKEHIEQLKQHHAR